VHLGKSIAERFLPDYVFFTAATLPVALIQTIFSSETKVIIRWTPLEKAERQENFRQIKLLKSEDCSKRKFHHVTLPLNSRFLRPMSNTSNIEDCTPTSKKRWVFSLRVLPPQHTIMGRWGATVMDVFYSKILNQWYAVLPGGTLEKVTEPQMIFVSDAWARDHQRDLTKHPRRENPLRIRAAKAEQLTLL
jgi:hypothetical protein